MAERVSDREVERRLLGLDHPITQPTLSKHRHKHLTTEHVQQLETAVEQLKVQQKTFRSDAAAKSDLATLIRDTVTQEVIDGNLKPTIRDGLTAIDLIEKREARGADRDLMVKLALVLGGSRVIEGTYRDVTPEAIEDDEAFARLTAGA